MMIKSPARKQTTMSPTQDKYEAIKRYVLAERKRLGITRLTPERKSEMSGEGFGEFTLLLERQLLTTPEGMGAWSDLQDEDILDGVYQEVVRADRNQKPEATDA